MRKIYKYPITNTDTDFALLVDVLICLCSDTQYYIDICMLKIQIIYIVCIVCTKWNVFGLNGRKVDFSNYCVLLSWAVCITRRRLSRECCCCRILFFFLFFFYGKRESVPLSVESFNYSCNTIYRRVNLFNHFVSCCWLCFLFIVGLFVWNQYKILYLALLFFSFNCWRLLIFRRSFSVYTIVSPFHIDEQIMFCFEKLPKK